MSTAQTKIEAYARREKLKKVSILLIPIIIAALGVGIVFYSNDQSGWSNREVTGVMVFSTHVAMKTGGFHRVEVLLENGATAYVRIDRIGEFRKGRKVLLNESKSIESGRIKYRFIRGIE